MSIGTVSSLKFLAGGGELGALTRAKDWSQTPLGPPNTWPQSLRTALSILLNSRFPMFLWWGNDLIQFYNDAYRPSLGNEGKHPAAVGQRGVDCWPEIWPTIKPLIDRVRATHEATWSKDQLIPIYRNGRLEDVYWTFSYSAVLDESGQVGGVLVVCQETTQQVKIFQRLEASQHELRQLFEQAPVAIGILRGPSFVVELANPGMCEIWNRREEQVLGKPIFEVLTEAAGQGFEDLLTGVLETGVPFVGNELPAVLLRDGQPKTVYVNFVYAPQAEADGRITGITAVATDVTEQVLARRKIEESDYWFRHLADSMPHIVWTARPDGFLDYFNRRWYEFLGNDLGFGDAGWLPILHPDDRQPCLDHWQHCLHTGEPYRFEFRLDDPHQPGHYRWYLALASAFRDEGGQIIKWFGSCTDIDAQKQAEVALRESANRFRFMAEAMPQKVWTADAAGNVKYFNQIWLDYTGLSFEELKNWGWKRTVYPDDWEANQRLWQRSIDTGQPFELEHRFLRHDGAYRWHLSRGLPQRDETPEGQPGAIRMWIGTNTDIHDQKTVTERLETLVRERTVALEQANLGLQRTNLNLSQFAYVASHDLQEPLRKIQAFGDMLFKRNAAQLDEAGAERIRRMQDSAERMGNLIRDLLDYSRVSSYQETFAPVDLNEVFKSVRSDLAVSIREKKASLLADPLPTVQGDATQLRQVLQNLVSNAIKFSRPDVPPLVEIRCRVLPGAEAGGLNLPPEAYFYEISVSDNGIGFEETYADRIFEAFQRLHGRGEYPGTGIGLAIVRKVAENHHGGVSVSSRVGEGSSFRVYLPVGTGVTG